jgi:UDP-N-acetylmuramate--alanine ligase
MKVPPNRLLKVIHFIGIGGIGMSGIAEIIHNLGYLVSGSDVSSNTNTRHLQSLGITVNQGHCSSYVEQAQVVVISSALGQDNLELSHARKLGIPILHRSEMLAELMQLKLSLVVAGTHGKTTTTSLGAALLDSAQMDPTVINGGIINAYNTNARLGTGQWMVVEADESDGSFTRLFPTIGIITNIDNEHMEYYKSEEALHESFRRFLGNIPFYGVGIVCADHPVTMALASSITNRRLMTYGFHEQADVRGCNVRLEPEGSYFDVDSKEQGGGTGKIFHCLDQNHNVHRLPKRMKEVFLPMVGQHNVQNALAIIAAAQVLGIDEQTIRQALSNFGGVKRRFTHVGTVGGVRVIDDYAHHPVEIQAVIRSAHQIRAGVGRVIAVVQPHRFSRLRDCWDDFSHCFQGADEVVVCPIYGAGEEPIEGVTGILLSEHISINCPLIKCRYINNSMELSKLIASTAHEGDIVLCMGAGTITHWAHDLVQFLQASYNHNKTSLSFSMTQAVRC